MEAEDHTEPHPHPPPLEAAGAGAGALEFADTTGLFADVAPDCVDDVDEAGPLALVTVARETGMAPAVADAAVEPRTLSMLRRVADAGLEAVPAD